MGMSEYTHYAATSTTIWYTSKGPSNVLKLSQRSDTHHYGVTHDMQLAKFWRSVPTRVSDPEVYSGLLDRVAGWP
eukprot:5504740-Amphidinium_carterae.1